jgi:hypothetical protein
MPSLTSIVLKGRRPSERASLEIITGQIKTETEPGNMFVIVRDRDGQAKADGDQRQRFEKLLYLPHLEDFGSCLGRHWGRLSRARWKVWHGNVYGAYTPLTSFYDGVDNGLVGPRVSRKLFGGADLLDDLVFQPLNYAFDLGIEEQGARVRVTAIPG